MEHDELWLRLGSWIFGIAGGLGAFIGGRALRGFDKLQEKQSIVESRCELQYRAVDARHDELALELKGMENKLLQTKLDIADKYVEKVDYIRLENKIEAYALSNQQYMGQIESKLNDKMDKLPERILALLKD